VCSKGQPLGQSLATNTKGIRAKIQNLHTWLSTVLKKVTFRYDNLLHTIFSSFQSTDWWLIRVLEFMYVLISSCLDLTQPTRFPRYYWEGITHMCT
jgi:hypothetical protein